MDTLKQLQWRYAVKKFDDSRILPSEKIEIVKKTFQLTPLSEGLQPIRLIIIQDKKLQKRLEEFSYFQKQVATASHLLVFCIETSISSRLIHNKFDLEKEIRDTSEEILQPFRENLIRNFDEKNLEEKKAWAINQIYLTMGSLLSVCAIENIDACPMEGFDVKKYDEILNLDEKGLHSTLVMPIGYRANDDMFSKMKKVRRPLKDIVIEIKNKDL